MRPWTLAWFGLMTVACVVPIDGNVDAVPPGDSGIGPDSPLDLDPGVPIGPAEEGCDGESTIPFEILISGDTSMGGWNEPLAEWFGRGKVACDPLGTDYPPPYQVYSLEMPATVNWEIVVEPDPGVDASLVTWLQSAADPTCYPERGIGVVTCEVSNAGDAGAVERTDLTSGSNPFHMVILVSTPPGGTPGPFRLGVQRPSP